MCDPTFLFFPEFFFHNELTPLCEKYIVFCKSAWSPQPYTEFFDRG